MLVAFFRVERFPRDDLDTPSPLQPLRIAPVVGEEVFHRSEQERTKTSFFWTHSAEGLVCDKPQKKTLREILRCMRIVTSPAHKDIKRIPISAAQPLESAASFFRRVARAQYNAPASRAELAAIDVRSKVESSGKRHACIYGISDKLASAPWLGLIPTRKMS
jgi:hypothetical protein